MMDVLEKAKKVCADLAAAGWAVILLVSKYAGDSTQFSSFVQLPQGGDAEALFLRADQVLSRLKRQASPFSPSEGILIGGTLTEPDPLFVLLQDLHQAGWNAVAWAKQGPDGPDHALVSLRENKAEKVTLDHAFCDLKREMWNEWSGIAHAQP